MSKECRSSGGRWNASWRSCRQTRSCLSRLDVNQSNSSKHGLTVKRSAMKYARQNLMSPEELANEYGISAQRLADLRSQGKGPPYFKFGGVWYPKVGFDRWAEENMKGSENGASERETAIGITGSSTSGKNTPATPIWPPHHKTRKTRKQSKQQLCRR